MENDNAKTDNNFHVLRIVNGYEYLCEMCHELCTAVVTEAKFNDGKKEMIYLNLNELSLPMVNKTHEKLNSYTLDLKVIRMCDACYKRLIVNLLNMATINMQNKIQKN